MSSNFSLLTVIVMFSSFTQSDCGLFDRVTAEVPIEFEIPISFDIDAALKLANLDQLPDTMPPGIKREDIVVPLPMDLSSSIADREEIKQYANRIYNIRIENLSFRLDENGFSQEVRNSILGIAKKSDVGTSSSKEKELILISTLPKITPEMDDNTTTDCNVPQEIPDSTSPYRFNTEGYYICEPQFDSDSADQCNMIPGGRDAPSEHLKKLEFRPEILYCDPKTKSLKEGILLYIDSDKYTKRPSGNIKMKIHLKIVLRVAPLG